MTDTSEIILKKHNLTSTICRVAGGWVRDKLLGKESDDIDIAINNMKGSKLAQLIKTNIKSKYRRNDKPSIETRRRLKNKNNGTNNTWRKRNI